MLVNCLDKCALFLAISTTWAKSDLGSAGKVPYTAPQSTLALCCVVSVLVFVIFDILYDCVLFCFSHLLVVYRRATSHNAFPRHYCLFYLVVWD